MRERECMGGVYVGESVCKVCIRERECIEGVSEGESV